MWVFPLVWLKRTIVLYRFLFYLAKSVISLEVRRLLVLLPRYGAAVIGPEGVSREAARRAEPCCPEAAWVGVGGAVVTAATLCRSSLRRLILKLQSREEQAIEWTSWERRKSGARNAVEAGQRRAACAVQGAKAGGFQLLLE